jgi:hypothetical protein
VSKQINTQHRDSMSARKNNASVTQPVTPAEMGTHWNNRFYDAVQEIFWDPQLIGRRPMSPRKYANEWDMLSGLRRLEVPLNHILGFFFSLAPQDFVEKLESRVFSDGHSDTYRSVGIFELRQTHPHDPTQPDVFLVSTSTCMSIEVKIASKSDEVQVAKYAMLHGVQMNRNGKQSRSRLIYLTPRPMAKTWREGHANPMDLKLAMADFDHRTFLKRHRMDVEMSPEELAGQIEMLEIGHLNFSDFHLLAGEYFESLTEDTPTVGTVKRLMEGLLHELEFRRSVLNIP